MSVRQIRRTSVAARAEHFILRDQGEERLDRQRIVKPRRQIRPERTPEDPSSGIEDLHPTVPE
jgi:hypothetical protein